MVPISVLLANEPRVYRDTVAVALRMLRPGIDVIVTEPDALDSDILLHKPHVVICSDLTNLLEARVPTWIVLYPSGDGGVLLNVDGERTTVPGMDLKDVIDLVDQTNLRAHSGAGLGADHER